MDDRIDELEREILFLKKKLLRSENSRKLIEQAKDQYDLVYRTSIMRLDQQRDLLNQARTELLEKNQQLESAQKSAEAANEAKSRFLANMSHEIRTPLNGILGFLELLQLTFLDETQKKYLNEVRNSSELLLYIINDILDFSKIEAGYLEIDSHEFDLLETINSALAVIRPKAEKKGIRIERIIDPETPVKVVGDSSRLLQILNNLLGNAVKFTERGFVRLTVKCGDVREGLQQIEFIVEDSGVGLQGIDEEILFNAFSQADSSVTRKYGGTGLGLAISRELVQMMGGSIRIQKGIDAGATFIFSIRLPVASDQQSGHASSYNIESMFSVSPMRILLAEDNEINAKLVEIILNQMGLRCDVVNDGKSAVEKCMEEEYDLILMDCQMPGMDGYQATRDIRSLKGPASTVYILAMTANAMAGDKNRCHTAGMNDYISKPIIMKDFIEKIQDISKRIGAR